MDFALSDEQRMLLDMARRFVEEELYPHEDEVERLNEVPPELQREIRAKAMELGIYAANMPEELGGGGLDNVSLVLLERELGRAAYALQYLVARPSNILQACAGEQVEQYLLPTIRGERLECLAADRNDALLVALAEHPNQPLIQAQINQLQPGQLADTQTRCIH